MKRFFFLPLALFATVNEPLRVELYTGYRNDRLHWHLKQPGEHGPLTYSELYRDLQFWENGISFKVIHRDLFFFLKGNYGGFGNGDLFQRFADLSFTSEEPRFQFNANGWSADGSGSFGYAVNLTSDRTYKVLLIPLLGYSGHFEQLHRTHPQPNPYTSSPAIGADFFSMQSTLPQKLHMTWYGFFLGGGFQVEPGGRLILQAGYTYHWMRMRFKTHDRTDVSLFNDGPILVSETNTLTRVKSSAGDNHGHTGWAQLDYCLTRAWRLGFGAQIRYFASRVVDASIQQSGLPDSSEKLKLRWVPISGWFQLSREL